MSIGQDRDVFADAPRFFRRAWTPDIRPGQIALEAVTIYGRLDPSDIQEDRDHEIRAWRANGHFPATCFSVNAPSGEYGLVPIGQITEISEQDFLAAQQRGWANT